NPLPLWSNVPCPWTLDWCHAAVLYPAYPGVSRPGAGRAPARETSRGRMRASPLNVLRSAGHSPVMFDSDSPHRLRHVPAAARLLRRAPRRRLGIAASSALALGLLMTTAAAQPTEAPAPPTDDEASSPALSQA